MIDYPLPVTIPELRYFQSADPFITEGGHILSSLTIGYHLYGDDGTNTKPVIWVCHALTANSHVADWWSGLFGEGNVLDPAKYRIICANFPGSCYGSTGPRSIDKTTGEPFGTTWPLFTIRDWVRAHDLLRKNLGINEIELCIGGSCGGHQVLEFCLLQTNIIKRIVLVATSAYETPWSIALHEAQRMSMEADPSFFDNYDDAGKKGMEAARALALTGYRTYDAFVTLQKNEDERVIDHKVASYIRYQGAKLGARFYAHAYYHLLNSLDTHSISRGRGDLEKVLSCIQTPTLIIGIESDRLIPLSEQQRLHQCIPGSAFHIISSAFGHDGFLIETEALRKCILPFIQAKP